MGDWYIFQLAKAVDLGKQSGVDLRDKLDLIPGAKLNSAGNSVSAAENCAWLVSELFDREKVAYTLRHQPIAKVKLPQTDDGRRLIETLESDGKLKKGIAEWLFPHQVDAILHSIKRDASLLMHGCGLGKSASAVVWSLFDPKLSVIVTPAAVRRQFGREVDRLTNGKAKVLAPGGESGIDAIRSDIANGVTHLVVGIESLPKYKEVILALKPSSLIIDECFLGTTLVVTDVGEISIGSIVNDGLGSEVLCLDPSRGCMVWRRIVRRISLPLTRRLVQIDHEFGSLVCTENHEIWTEEYGYVGAASVGGLHLRVLREGVSVSTVESEEENSQAFLFEGVQRPGDREGGGETSDREELRVVQAGILVSESGQGSEQDTILRAKLLSELADDAAGDHREYASRNAQALEGKPRRNAGNRVFTRTPRPILGADESEESDVRSEGKGARVGSKTGPAISDDAGRERAFDRAAGDPCRSSRLGSGSCDWGNPNGASPSGEDAEELQGRYRESGVEAGDRGRWKGAQVWGGKGSRREENSGLVAARVDRVTFLKHDDPRRLAYGAAGDRVYDLEIDGLHNYIANGVVVSNCHKLKSRKRWNAAIGADSKLKFSKNDNIASAAFDLSRMAKRRMGLTATFIANRTEDAWAQLDILEPNQWGPFYKTPKEDEDRRPHGFGVRFCDGRAGAWGGIDTKGFSNLDELVKRLSWITHSVSKADANLSLPPVRREVIHISSEEQVQATGFLKEIQASMAKGAAFYAETLLAEAAARKRRWVVEYVESAAEDSQKIVVLTGRHKDCEKLYSEFLKHYSHIAGLRIWNAPGSLSPSQRDIIKNEYVASEGPAILVGTAEAWGTGVDGLQCTDLAVNCMLPWTLSQVEQREGRFSRPGQTRPVRIVYPIADNTYDEKVASILLSKLPAVAAMNGSDVASEFGSDLKGCEKLLLASLVGKLTASEEIDE